MQEGERKPNCRRVPLAGEEDAALGMPVWREQLCCFLQGDATVLFPKNITSVMFKFIPNLVYLASVSQRNHV